MNTPIENEDSSNIDLTRPPTLNVRAHRRHETILVSARRGEGKTTFLTTILRSIETGSYRAKLGGEKASTLYSLGIIDPTLIENKQNIIVIVIDLLRTAANHRRQRLGHGNEEFEPVQKALRKLARGLTVLDGIGDTIYSGRDWVDVEYVLDTGLENASAAHKFERSLQDYVRVVAKYLEIDAFVLAIDDVDTWFESGWPVLEAIRKYLVTPRLRIILSGDLNLYSLLVRRQQWAQMTGGFLDAEEKRESAERGSSQIREIGRMVDALQDQYLIKVAPLEGRVQLRSLEQHASEATLFFAGAGLAHPMFEAVFINLIADRFLAVRSAADVQLLRQQILRLPVRSALQTLRGLARFASDHSARELPRSVHSDALDALRHVAWTSLMTVGVEVSERLDADVGMVISTIAEWLTRSRLWLPLARFLPDNADEHLNLVAVYYGAVLADAFRLRPGKMFDYWLKLSIVREKIDSGAVDPDGQDEPAQVSRLVSHLNLGASESAIQTVSRLAAWDAVERSTSRALSRAVRFSGVSVPLDRIRGDGAARRALYGTKSGSGSGTPDIKGFQGLSEKLRRERTAFLSKVPGALRNYHEQLLDAGWHYDQRFLGYLGNAVEELSERLDRNAAMALLLPRSRIVSGQNSETGNYSVLRLIAVIGELIDAPLKNDNRPLHQGIERILFDATQARSYPTPGSRTDGLGGTPADDDDAGDQFVSDNEASRDFSNETLSEHLSLEYLIERWLVRSGTEHLAVAPITLSRMWTRFTYASTNVRSALRVGESRYLGVLFHRTIIAFLHAVGLEAMRAANVQPPPGASSNPVQSSRVFAQLLDAIYDRPDYDSFRETPEFSFFHLLFTCPLWAYFLILPAGGFEGMSEGDAVPDSDQHVLAFYMAQTGLTQDDEMMDVARVALRSPRRNEPVAIFHGLHALLNSIPILGEIDTAQRTPIRKAVRRVPTKITRATLASEPDAT